ncbi:Uncharacterized protein dnm_013550 [Desulfonema magnum]|uniref:Uncharacterized protein n=1 Tax=Desulfonema magnum TaxID=45655 RepID=A0A975GL99_9BACT|nr:Uncharacterized protein dnm_013550 [Desulfonema magnum]
MFLIGETEVLNVCKHPHKSDSNTDKKIVCKFIKSDPSQSLFSRTKSQKSQITIGFFILNPE